MARRTPDPRAPAAAPCPIRLLHLANLGFCTAAGWNGAAVLAALIEQIQLDVTAGLVPDLVAITGDLACCGKAKEYDRAHAWLETDLWPALRPAGSDALPRDRLLLVPGNHDVDRSQVNDTAGMVQDGLLAKADQDKIAAVLGNANQRKNLLHRHAAYGKFRRKWFGRPEPLPWWQRRLPIGGQHLHLAGLDSAWMSCADDERNRLLIGRYQIHQTILQQDRDGADWHLALLHHPWEYLAEFDQRESQEAIRLHCDLVLHGHVPEARLRRVQSSDPRRTCIELAAGGIDPGGGGSPAFQWIELQAQPRAVRVWFRCWNKGQWQPDRNQPGTDQAGMVEFPIESKGTDPKGDSRHAPAVPAVYLDWLRRTYAGFDLLGQDTPQGSAITLSQVYVPAVTTPPAPQPGDPDASDPRAGAAGPRGEPPAPSLLLARLDAGSLYACAAPGGGKTTFCRWALLQSLPGSDGAHPVPPPDGYAEPLPHDLRRRLPLLVPLREFWRDLDCGHGQRLWYRHDLEAALSAWAERSTRSGGLDGALLKAHLERGRVFLLLDGLDEVPTSERRGDCTVHPRALLVSGLADALPGWEASGHRVLLTSRPYGLSARDLARLGLPSAPLEPLPEPLQALFVTRWFHTLKQPALAPGLLADLRGRDELAPLAENPMLLKAMCIIYGKGQRLPEDKYRLYERIVDNVLDNRYEDDANDRAPVKAALEAVALGMHCGPEDARETPAAEVSQAEIEGLLAHFNDTSQRFADGRIQAALDCEGLLTRSGLLLPRPDERAAFYHLSLQEFLAAVRLARTNDDTAGLEAVFRRRGAVADWRPTLLFLFAAQIFIHRTDRWGLDLLGRLAADLDRQGVKTNPAPALLVAEALELCLAKGYTIPPALAEGFRQTCLDAIADAIPPIDRQTLGLCLGRLGDPRILSLRDPAAYAEVPAGDYPYGEGEEQERVRIAEPFLLSRYPVTNSQYREFMEAGGYTHRDLWSQPGWDWLQSSGVSEPDAWTERRWNAPNQPVIGVSFWEAEACCRWAGGQLPTEREWEAAARGPEGHEYPWGGAWEDGICNSWEAGLRVTSPVGLFPRSRQARLPLDDLAGNVWEWCDDFYYRDQTAGGSPRVLRGGSFAHVAWDLRASFRDRGEPVYRGGYWGFRCVLAAPRQPLPSTD